MFRKLNARRHEWAARRQVARGIAWLENTEGVDQQLLGHITGQPLNIDRINLVTLDVERSNVCALAQASGWDYNQLMRSYRFDSYLGYGLGWMKRHGFNSHNFQHIDALNREWRRQLTERRAKSAAAIRTYVQTQFADDVKAFVEAVRGL